MANNHDDEELAPDLRALFQNYPHPTANAEFDAKFWRELDARQNRYRGFTGLARRLIEVEIEGIAVWRLGLSLLGGAAVCGVGVALLSLGASPSQAPTSAALVAQTEQIPTVLPRYARELDELRAWDAPLARPSTRPKPKEEISCASSARGLV